MNEILNDAETIELRKRMAMTDDGAVRKLMSHELSRYVKVTPPVLELKSCLLIAGDDYQKSLCKSLCGKITVCRFICTTEQRDDGLNQDAEGVADANT